MEAETESVVDIVFDWEGDEEVVMERVDVGDKDDDGVPVEEPVPERVTVGVWVLNGVSEPVGELEVLGVTVPAADSVGLAEGVPVCVSL